MKTQYFLTLTVLVMGSLLATARADDEAQIESLLKKMTLEEKIGLLHANSKFTVAGVPRLGIPPITLSDGPHGVREEIAANSWDVAGWTNDFSTALPCGSALAATWNTAAASRSGETLGSEARDRKKDIILGPSVNLHRTPLCGRNFEYMSEDPLLAATMVAPVVRGIQSQDVAACVKHFAANSQELNRMQVNEKIDERVLRELYLSAFRAAVQKGGVLTVMAAYNRINGEPCVQNKKLISILKDDFGFRGILMSDWGIQGIETVAAAANGLDLEMGTEQPYDNFYFANPLLDSVKAGKTPISVIDDKVRRRLRVQMAIHAMGGPRKPGSRNTPEHSAAARAIAAESIVLLKNTAGLLPLDRAGVKRLLVIGVNATAKHAHEGGSSMIKSNYEITPLAGLQAKLGDAVKIDYLPGYVVVPRNAKAEEKSKAAKDGDRLRTEAVAAAKDADAVLYVGGLNHQFDSEGDDRPDMKLPYAQDTLIADLLAANPKTVVVLVGGSPVEMPWVDRAGSLVWMYYGGQEAGRALADVLLGDANPSGHLPTTFPKRLADSPAHALPGAYADKIVVYKEGLLVGYRWFDKKGIEPLFPFGHGLSYTSFSLSNPQASVSKDGATVSLDVQNTGKRAGAEVVQVYVGQPHCSVERPVRELKGFAKVMLQPGQSKRVEIALPREAFAFWHPQKRAWTVEPGQFVIEIGDSSRSLPCKMTVVVP